MLLRDLVRQLIQENLLTSAITGAGVVVVKRVGKSGRLEDYRILCIRPADHIDDLLDLPKGHIHTGESALACAKRETFEESGIDDLSFTWGLKHVILDGMLVMFVAETKSDGKLKPNPDTGILEHDKILWLDVDIAAGSVMGFLRPVISWAKQKLSE